MIATEEKIVRDREREVDTILKFRTSIDFKENRVWNWRNYPFHKNENTDVGVNGYSFPRHTEDQWPGIPSKGD